MQFSLRRMFYFVAIYCLAVKAATLVPFCLDYPFVYTALVFAVFGAAYYELTRLGVQG